MAHEDLTRKDQADRSSDRSFGIVFGIVFALIGIWPVMHQQPVRWWSFCIAAAFLVTAALRPVLLSALNKLWYRIGIAMGRVVSPIALGIVFYGVIAPLGWSLKVLGKDPLRLKRDAKASTYWIERQPPG